MSEKELFLAKLKMLYPSVAYHSTFGNLLIVTITNGKYLVFRKSDYKLLHEALDLTKATDAYLVSKTSGTGVIDKLGNEIIPFIYDCIVEESHRMKGIFLVSTMEGKMGAYKSDGTKLIESKYDYINIFESRLFRTELEDYVGLLDKDGKEILECKYLVIHILTDNLFKVKLGNKKWGILNRKSEFVVPPVYNTIIDISGKLKFVTDTDVKMVNLEEFKSGNYTL